jgi:anti-sigma-K factor RskA
MKTHEQFADELASYALGEVDASVCQEMEQHLASCPACRRELQQLRADLGLLALSAVGPAPPSQSKERLLRAIAAEPRGARPAPTEIERTAWRVWVPLFAALGLFIFAVMLWRDNGRMKDQLAELVNRNQDQSVQLTQMSNQLRLLTAPDAVHVSLNPQKSPRQPSGTAIISPSQKRMMFMASNLPQVPNGMAYELWIIPMKGAPMAAGVFKPDEHGNAMMMDHPMPAGVEAKAFALTVEKEEGSDKPTSPIVIMGEMSQGE